MAVLFIGAVWFGIWFNSPYRQGMSWFHELGHITVGGGRILNNRLSSVVFDNIFVDYAGSYGQVFYMTLMTFILYKLGMGLTLTGWFLGTCFPVWKDPFYQYDWEGSSLAAKSAFEVYLVLMIILQIVIISFLVQKIIDRQVVDRRKKWV